MMNHNKLACSVKTTMDVVGKYILYVGLAFCAIFLSWMLGFLLWWFEDMLFNNNKLFGHGGIYYSDSPPFWIPLLIGSSVIGLVYGLNCLYKWAERNC